MWMIRWSCAMSPDTERVLIIGAGGHARVIASLLTYGRWSVEGVLDRRQSQGDERIGGHPIVGTIDDADRWLTQGVRRVALASGSNRERAAWHARFTLAGFEVIGMRHPGAFVERNAIVAVDAVLCARALVAAEAQVGANVLLNSGCIVEHECVIDDHAQVAPGAKLAGRVTVGVGAFIGMGACIKEKVRIGRGAVIGAGAVVLEDVPDNAVAVGVPARVRSELRSPWKAAA
jgi:sugar O-acyltransferase (sialic acid O-acetyltransferase NeuD family)